MLDRPWARLLLGALAAAALGALAARVALSVPSGEDGANRSPAGAGRLVAGAPRSRTGGGGPAETGAGQSGTTGSAVSATVGGGSGTVTVHVTGAVRRPGVYELREGSRVFEALRKAGGAGRRADRQRLNLAAPVRDGQQVLVPERAPRAAGGAGGAGVEADSAGGDAPVDLNTATLEQLQTLDGVGPATAEKIVALREERGGLAGVDDLDEVPGIGPKKLEALRGQLGG